MVSARMRFGNLLMERVDRLPSCSSSCCWFKMGWLWNCTVASVQNKRNLSVACFQGWIGVNHVDAASGTCVSSIANRMPLNVDQMNQATFKSAAASAANWLLPIQWKRRNSSQFGKKWNVEIRRIKRKVSCPRFPWSEIQWTGLFNRCSESDTSGKARHSLNSFTIQYQQILQ